MKEYYKIGEISNLYGICTDSLRYYEEIGILKPKRDDNGYRMYSISDIRTLNILRDLRSIGLSMGEIKTHLANFDLTSTMELFEKEIHTINEKMDNLQALKEQLSDRITEIHHHLHTKWNLEEPEINLLPERKILQLSEHVYRDENLDFIIKKLQKENEDQLYLIGNGDIGATIPLQSLEQGTYGYFSSAFCISQGSFDTVISGGSYLCYTVKGSYRLIPDAWKRMFSYMEKEGLTAEADPIELYIIDNHDTNKEDEYITQLQVKVSAGKGKDNEIGS